MAPDGAALQAVAKRARMTCKRIKGKKWTVAYYYIYNFDYENKLSFEIYCSTKTILDWFHSNNIALDCIGTTNKFSK